jgi:hypothetical protein
MGTATLTALDGTALPLDVPVNVKVKGERQMRKAVTLIDNGDGAQVRVKTGKRGRPATLAVENIEKVRAL